MLFYFIYVIR